MAFILSGSVKDIVIVCTASYLTNYPWDEQQIIGFTRVLYGMAYWGLTGKLPEYPLIAWLPRLPHYEEASKEEQEKLVPLQPVTRDWKLPATNQQHALRMQQVNPRRQC